MKTELEWHYLPELPSDNRCVLAALTFSDSLLPAYYSETMKRWMIDTAEIMDYFDTLGDEECLPAVYAWAEMVKPPKKEDK
jgi:hypothetical protein